MDEIKYEVTTMVGEATHTVRVVLPLTATTEQQTAALGVLLSATAQTPQPVAG